MKDLSEKFDEIMKDMGGFIEDLKETIESATGKSLEEIAKMPTSTDEEKAKFLDMMNKVKDAITSKVKEDKDKQGLDKSFINITGGKHHSKIEACGKTCNLVNLLAQGLATVMARNMRGLSDERFKEFGKIFMEEVKDLYDGLLED